MVTCPPAVIAVFPLKGSAYQRVENSAPRAPAKSPLTWCSCSHMEDAPNAQAKTKPKNAKSASGSFMSHGPIFLRFQQNSPNRKSTMPVAHKIMRSKKTQGAL